MGEYVPYERLGEIIADEKERGKRIVLTGGCFDLFHPGHKNLLELSTGFGDVLVANVVSRERVEHYKGLDGPFMSGIDRAIVVSGMEYVDYATVHPSVITNPTIDLAFSLEPDVLVQSKLPEEESMEERRLEELQKMGVEFILIGRSSYDSGSRDIVKKIRRRKRAPTNYRGSRQGILT